MLVLGAPQLAISHKNSLDICLSNIGGRRRHEHEQPLRVDCVEERSDRRGAGAAPGFEPKRVIGFPPLGGGDRLWFGDELGQLAQVLGDGCEVEFVAGATGPAQPQPVEPQNAFECANSISTFFR
jgi:hypothetical protein